MNKQEFINLCKSKLKELGLTEAKYIKRLKWELKEADIDDEFKYFIKLHELKVKLPNENNLLIPFLAGICEEFDADKDPNVYNLGAVDIDVDYEEATLDYLKEEYLPKKYGKDNVCAIGTYGTLQVRMVLLDLARVFETGRSEMLKITKTLQKKDDEGQSLDLDSAVATTPELKKYFDDHPAIRDAAYKLVGKNKSFGTHASGIVISNSLADIPIMRGAGGRRTSGWIEGQQATDLSSFGYYKFDFLGSKGMSKIAGCLKMVYERYGMTNMCAVEGGDNWSDDSYLNDPKALAMANCGDTKTIFQLDSDGIRAMIKRGGVTSFDDLVAYISLYRPGALDIDADKKYIDRKNGRETYELHPILESILGNTYGVLLYQEQAMQLLTTVGGINSRDTYDVLKGISKKKMDIISKYKDRFIANGKKVLNCSKEEVADIFATIQSLGGYAFNKSHGVVYAIVSARELYLKAHYPLEYAASVLKETKLEAKMIEYINDAKAHDIKFAPLNINKSKAKFYIDENDVIRFPFSRIKGIGPEAAEEMEANQPYKDVIDFAEKYGTDASIFKPIIALRLFDGDPVENYKLYLSIKDRDAKIKAYKNRVNTRIEKYNDDIRFMLEKPYDKTITVDNVKSDNRAVIEKVQEYHELLENAKLKIISIKEEELVYKENKRNKIDEEFMEQLLDVEIAENKYLGFTWNHPLDKYDTKGLTFDKLLTSNFANGPVEVRVLTAGMRQGKKAKYCFLEVEDAAREIKSIFVWERDYHIWKDYFIPENMLCLNLSLPKGDFSGFTLAPKFGKEDYRVRLLHKK